MRSYVCLVFSFTMFFFGRSFAQETQPQEFQELDQRCTERLFEAARSVQYFPLDLKFSLFGKIDMGQNTSASIIGEAIDPESNRTYLEFFTVLFQTDTCLVLSASSDSDQLL